MTFHDDIIKLTSDNDNFRRELVTGKHSQLTIMSIPAGGEIGEEVHHVDQLLVFVSGKGEAILNDEIRPVEPNHLVFVPAGTKHNFKNTGQSDMKLYTVYAPAEHLPGTVHKTKADADADENEHHES